VGRGVPRRMGGGIDRPVAVVQFAVVTTHGDDVQAEARVGREDAMIAVAMDAGRRDEAAEGRKKFQGGEDEDGATIGGGPRRVVEDLADGGHCGGPGGRVPLSVALDAKGVALDAKALEGEGRPGAVSEQPLLAR